ncbi:glycosyl hydrolase [Clostridia bacterium]|nr:glycosyl hydrolase [Clostridia bacterium]
MILYEAKQGDTVDNISRRTGVSADTIIRDNQLADTRFLAPGQYLVISDDQTEHVVRPGETLYTIAETYSIPYDALLAANPQFDDPSVIVPGDVVNLICDTDKPAVTTIGFCHPDADIGILRSNSRGLTYLGVCGYRLDSSGKFIDANAGLIAGAANKFGTAPLINLSFTDEYGNYNDSIKHLMLNSAELQRNLADDGSEIYKARGFGGVIFDLGYVSPEYCDKATSFVNQSIRRIRTLSPETAVILTIPMITNDAECAGYDIKTLNENCDFFNISTCSHKPTEPGAFIYTEDLTNSVKYIASMVDPQKILIGISNFGYDYTVDNYTPMEINVLSSTCASEIAQRKNVEITHDIVSEQATFRYRDAAQREHEVWFESTRSRYAKMKLVQQYNLGGMSYWTVDVINTKNQIIQNSLYSTKKLI